jgi:hAT family protein
MSLRRPTLQAILDPRIKTQWIRDNLENADDIIRRIRTFLKETYRYWIGGKQMKANTYCMAQAARDYLAIPSSEADIERLFSLRRDILGIRRFSMGMDTMRTLVLLLLVLV